MIAPYDYRTDIWLSIDHLTIAPRSVNAAVAVEILDQIRLECQGIYDRGFYTEQSTSLRRCQTQNEGDQLQLENEDDDDNQDGNDDNNLPSYLSEECLHGCSVHETAQTVSPLHECLTEVPGAWSVSPAHHIDAIGVWGWGLPGEVGIDRPPGWVGQVIIPTIVSLLLVLSRRHEGGGWGGEEEEQEGAPPPALIVASHSVSTASHRSHSKAQALARPRLLHCTVMYATVLWCNALWTGALYCTAWVQCITWHCEAQTSLTLTTDQLALTGARPVGGVPPAGGAPQAALSLYRPGLDWLPAGTASSPQDTVHSPHTLCGAT